MENHITLGHAESNGWDVYLTCHECGKEAEGEYFDEINGERMHVCNACAEAEEFLDSSD